MNGKRDPEEIIGAWLEENPGALPETTRRAIATSIRTIRQRRRPVGAPWRPEHMTPTKLALLVAALVVAIGGVTLLLNRGAPTDSGVGHPSPTITVSPSPVPSPVDKTGWQTFTSARHGFSVSYPATWRAKPASQPWNLDDDTLEGRSDDVLSTVEPIVMSFSVVGGLLPAGMTYEEFLADSRAELDASFPTECLPPQEEWGSIPIDGQQGSIYKACAFMEAQLFYRDRVWIFNGTSGLATDRPLFEAMLGTVRLHPDDADDTPVAGLPSSNPSASASPS